MKIYLAGRYSRRDELCGYRTQLEAAGHEVTSRWLDGNHQVDDQGLSEEGTPEERERFAREDLEDVLAANMLLAFTEVPRTYGSSRGGRHVEWGVAIGRGLLCWAVGPRENVFYCLPGVMIFATWEAALFVLSHGIGRGTAVPA